MAKTTTIRNWPGEVPTISGGTRTAIKLARPWQTRGPFANPLNCPFEPNRLKADKRRILKRSPDGSWVGISARFTPYRNHALVVPATCANWPEEKLRLLGGETEIALALELARRFITGKAVEVITINVGWLGGQNVGHPHWHAFTLPSGVAKHSPQQTASLLAKMADDDSSIVEDESFRAFAGGHRAGQCFILPKVSGTTKPPARLLSRVIDLYARKFRGTAGEELAPDFTIELIFDQGQFGFGAYVPILNAWGSTEYIALLGQQPVTLPWPHHLTAAYLRGEIVL